MDFGVEEPVAPRRSIGAALVAGLAMPHRRDESIRDGLRQPAAAQHSTDLSVATAFAG